MNNDIKNLILLSLFLIAISIVIILNMGKTYTIVFDINNADYNLLIENETGKIEVLDKKEKNSKYIVKVKAKKAGKVYLQFYSNGLETGKSLFIHKSMIITEDNFFGKSTGSEVIPISLSIILLYLLYILFKRYRFHLNENIYQYKNISYLGIIIFLSFFTINNILSIFNYNGIYETINRSISSLLFISQILLPLAFITFLLVTISNINLIKKEGKSLRNLLGLFLGLLICVLTMLPNVVYKLSYNTSKIDIYNLNKITTYLYNFFETLIYLTVVYLECILIATIIIAFKSIKKKATMNKDYMLILGCKIKEDGSLTPLLKGRVDRAIEFRNEQLKTTGKDLIFVPSGGRGNDEIISEATAMKNYLLEHGIKEKNILVENKSKNTYENIKFSNKLINNKKTNIGFSTTNYHVMRAGLIATEQGLKYDGIGSKTKTYYWINAFIREFIGTLHSEKKKHILAFLLISIIIIIMITITYLGNNI